MGSEVAWWILNPLFLVARHHSEQCSLALWHICNIVPTDTGSCHVEKLAKIAVCDFKPL